MSTKQDVADKFKSQLVAMMKRDHSMLQSCHDAGLTTTPADGLGLALEEIKESAKSVSLIEGFIDKHSCWSKIATKDKTFICNDLPKLFESNVFDTKVLVIPLECYYKIIEGKTMTGNQPVTQKDIDALWIYFKNMLTLACRYINKDKNSFPNVPLDKYVKEYQIKLEVN